MDELDHRILQVLQNEFPLSEKPYEAISEKLEISCEQLAARIKALMDDGVIRRIGASINSHKLGYCSTLAAISVADDVVERASEIIKGYPQITHSYLRGDEFNIWFTVIASSNERIEKILEEIRSTLSLESSQILNLPMTRLFKLNATFKTSL